VSGDGAAGPQLGGSVVLRLGTRRSALALAQSGAVARALEAAHPGLRVELVPIVTAGDRLPGDLGALGGKGLFTGELESGLIAGTLDLAVHSAKDLPVHIADELAIAAHPERADARDVLVSDLATSVAELPQGARVLTSSLRRQAQLLALRPDLRVEPIRGNVETRLRKWRQSGAAATVLAAAGLERLHAGGVALGEVPAHALAAAEMLPAPGQGTLAVQVRRGTAAAALCVALDHPATAIATAAERAVVAAFGGDCALPLAAWARLDDSGAVHLEALLALPDGTAVARGAAVGSTAEAAAARCVEHLRAAGADRLLATIAATRPGVGAAVSP
jgi:hydroxymethylbilane synthase